MRSLARLLVISSFLVAGCGSDQTSFSNSKDGGKTNPDAGLTGGATSSGGASNSGGATNSGGSSATNGKGGTGANMSLAGSGPGPDAQSGGSGPDSGNAGATGTGASSNTDGGGEPDSGGCPSGDVNVGGKCLKANAQACSKDTDCGSGNCVGGTCCKVACTAPGACEKLDGTTCQDGNTCTYGKQADGTADPQCDTGDKCSTAPTCFDGACTAGNPINCSDTDLCTVDDCDKATGCTHTPIDVTKPGNACDDNNVCTTDTCNSSIGCQHTNSDGAKAGCDDNDPCTTDACSGGICVSTPKNCANLDDACNVGVCSGGTCMAQPTNVNGACTKGLTSCDAGGKCNAAGTCVSTGNACGALSTACTPCTTGTNCSNNRLCTCAQPSPTDIVANGVCVVNTNDCATNPCGANGTGCTDPTPNTKNNDFVCTCQAGYSQKSPGTACTDVNECASGNPCVAGTCTNTTGSYDCTCASPLTKIQTSSGPQCACNLAGTYALVANTTVTYPAITVLGVQTTEGAPAGGLPTVAWAIRYNTVDASKGTVTSETVACGGSTPDVCDTAFGFAHAQYEPTQVFGEPGMLGVYPTITTSLAGVVPGGTYTEQPIALVSGIQLDDPLGAWPACAECVGPTHPKGSSCTCPGGSAFTITNGAQWLNNPDGLGHLGITTFAIPRGGLLTTATNPPPYDYTEPSVCPRLSKPTGTYGYAEFPGLATNNIPFRAYSWHAASRLQSTFKVDPKATGESISAQCAMTGAITGPDNGHAKSEARVQGCEICSNSSSTTCVAAGACSQAQYDSYDQLAQTQQIVSASFTLAPAPTGVGDFGATLAMTDGAAKVAAINKACGLVRAAYPAQRK
ncbi:MAG TPA: hypothetical protein VHC69_22700 [Polyangiaceae bacterium]|nr:hypothetical protein [Polyangiaceae bacterium]